MRQSTASGDDDHLEELNGRQEKPRQENLGRTGIHGAGYGITLPALWARHGWVQLGSTVFALEVIDVTGAGSHDEDRNEGRTYALSVDRRRDV
jgi:hypothetical protein